MKYSRRKIIKGAGAMAFAGLAVHLTSGSLSANARPVIGYGKLVQDKDKLLDLPGEFSYELISELGDKMDDGYRVPDRADGMGCIPLEGSLVALIRNHEIGLESRDVALSEMQKPLLPFAYDSTEAGEPLPGGTTTIIYDTMKGQRVREFHSLIGTARNCAGGITPWGSWLTCEEIVVSAGQYGQRDHGWVFEVPADINGLAEAVPLKAMGRFNHEAAAVDPKSGIVYLTEDRGNSLFYRFIPNEKGNLRAGGKLQALAISGHSGGFDSRNWDSVSFEPGSWRDTSWIDLEDIESPDDDLRVRGYRKGAAIFARGEGIIWGDDELYFCCTNGGAKSLGQIMRYQPSKMEGQPEEEDNPAKLQLFFESADVTTFGLGDNLTVAPNGHLIVCEDHYDGSVNHIRGITPAGELYTLARLVVPSETAGACFSPDGRTLFINVQSPTKTLAITGPWDDFIGTS